MVMFTARFTALFFAAPFTAHFAAHFTAFFAAHVTAFSQLILLAHFTGRSTTLLFSPLVSWIVQLPIQLFVSLLPSPLLFDALFHWSAHC